jgi:hypothetical protein
MDIVKGKPGLDDPIWEYVLLDSLKKYIPKVREWWRDYENMDIQDTGVVELDSNLPGLMARFTRAASRSPVKGIQAFPFIPTAFLQLRNIQGGANKMVERITAKGLVMDELKIVCKSNCPSTYYGGQIICFIPKKIYEEREFGKWIYFTRSQLQEIAQYVKYYSKALQEKLIFKL